MLPSALEHTGAISSDDFAISMRLMALPHAFVAVATFGVVDSTEAIAFASEHLAGIDIAEGVGLILHQDSSSIGIVIIGAYVTDHGCVAHGLFLVLVAAYQRDHIIGVLIPSIALFAFVEAGFRGRLTSLLGSVNSALAVVAALVLLYQFFWQAVVTGVVAVGLYILWDNLKEFRR